MKKANQYPLLCSRKYVNFFEFCIDIQGVFKTWLQKHNKLITTTYSPFLLDHLIFPLNKNLTLHCRQQKSQHHNKRKLQFHS